MTLYFFARMTHFQAFSILSLVLVIILFMTYYLVYGCSIAGGILCLLIVAVNV